MPTAVLDLDLASFRGTLSNPETYSRALVLVRWHGRPVARVWVPLDRGALTAGQLQEAVGSAPAPALDQARVRQFVGDAPHSCVIPPTTVAICTRERPDYLNHTLQAVAALKDRPGDVLVIDNCPTTSATWDVVRSHPWCRYVVEPRRGLDTARNRALQEAACPVVAFTDDDAAPDPAWLARLARNFSDPRVLCVTGLVMPAELETEAQEWFERYSPFTRGFLRRVFEFSNTDPLAVGQVGAGASMAVRRDISSTVGPFNETLDGGTPTQSGGDHDLFRRVIARGYRIVYEPEAVSWHRHRRTWPELRETLRGYGTGVYAMWTAALVEEGNAGVLSHAWGWFRTTQLPTLLRAALRRRDAPPLDLVLAELAGCAAGPMAWFRSRRLVARRRTEQALCAA